MQAAQAELAAATQDAEAASPAENIALERDQAARASTRAADARVSDAEQAVAEAELVFVEAQLAKRESQQAAQKVWLAMVGMAGGEGEGLLLYHTHSDILQDKHINSCLLPGCGAAVLRAGCLIGTASNLTALIGKAETVSQRRRGMTGGTGC